MDNIKDKRPILIIEDSPIDFEVTQRALAKHVPDHPLYHCTDGEQALNFLYHRKEYADPTNAPRPSLIFLDLNMPKINGREVLEQIKQDESLKLIPVVVMTTSIDRRDVNLCYSLGSNTYLQKAVDMDVFSKNIKEVTKYWFDVVVLPS